MNPLQIQTNAQGSFVTYKLEHQESLDRMTMGMLTNNKIKGMIPIDYSQIDSERWIKYDITSMQPLQSYLSGILTRKKALGIFSQIVNTFLLAEDYMIDASFIILDINNIYINAGTEELGIICLPVSGFVSNVTLQDLAANITRRGQFNSRENCDYVTKILNFVNGSQFSIAGFKDLLDELTRDSVQRIQRENMDHDMTGEAESALEEVNGQMAVAVESVADMVGQNTGNQRQQGIWIGDGKGIVREEKEKGEEGAESKAAFRWCGQQWDDDSGYGQLTGAEAAGTIKANGKAVCRGSITATGTSRDETSCAARPVRNRLPDQYGASPDNEFR